MQLRRLIGGARHGDREWHVRRLLLGVHLLGFDAAVDFDAAARIYRRCRSAGVTPRGMLDCMIASVASRHGASLLALDADMTRLADVVGADMDAASLSA